ncbi:unnamed protein product [Ilex paraguariensis]|uniref:RING-CH-type domain-containing protein n=1 Tax=Ilex paraguariensis TaxID=185542 RepID=A0ABC8S996_9AQUA
MGKENSPQTIIGGVSGEVCSRIGIEDCGTYSLSRHSIDKEAGLSTCRVCQCSESDKRGDAALGFLGITPPSRNAHASNEKVKPNCIDVLENGETVSHTKTGRRESGFLEFVSPKGEVFVCNTDIEKGFDLNQDILFELGCACKNDLALVHYACALKWFVNHGSTVCEICGCVAKTIRIGDFKKVMGSLKDYEALRVRTANGEPNPAQVQTNTAVDPDVVAAIRRQRLSEVFLWFNPHNNNNSATVSQVVTEQPSNVIAEEVVPGENPATKWAVEGTGILLATGLLTVTLAWLIAPRVGKEREHSASNRAFVSVPQGTYFNGWRSFSNLVDSLLMYGGNLVIRILLCVLVKNRSIAEMNDRSLKL